MSRVMQGAFLSEANPVMAVSRRPMGKFKEWVIESLLLLAALSSVAITLAIMFILIKESWTFFQNVPLWNFLTDTEWTPLFDNPRYGIMSLISGTLVSSAVALCIAIPIGTAIAMYISEFAPFKIREAAKPILELLAAIPTVVYGYFAFLVVTPILQKFIPDLPGFNLLSAGLVMGVMIIPYVSSLSEDAMRAVPMHLREGSYAMGATRFQTAWKVVTPAAFSGLAASYILAISRAVGETMVVSLAAGMQPNLTWNPLQPAATMTAYIVQVSQGDLPHGSIGYQSIFAVGLTLLLITLAFNIFGYWLRKRYREVY
jgi:phosphate transport system permease protein